jgi:hypothetical protein
MRFRDCVVLALTATALSACEDESGVTGPRPLDPAALVRFINAAADTGTVDLRFVDRIENLPTLQGVPFRGASGVYQRVIPGQRTTRVFPNSTDPAFASLRLIDTTLTLEANKRYTLVYAGQARGNQDRLVVFEEPLELPTPAAGMVAIRALHVAVGLGNVDVHIAADRAVADTLKPRPDPIATSSATIDDVTYLELTPFVTVAARASSDTLPLMTFGITPAGSSTLTFRTRSTLTGAPSTVSTVGASPGFQIGGSVLTAVIFAGGTAGSPAASVSTSPGVILIPDKPLNP